jgi:outer membrane lipoprotein-sorting protein
LVFGFWCFGACAADTNAILTAWLNAQTNLQTWSADFTQTRALKTLTQPLTANGRIWFAKPNQFRWQLGNPARTIAVRQADEMFVIYPKLKRAERYPAGAKAKGDWREALELLETGFPRDRAEFDSRFRILSLTEANGSWILGLQPTSSFARQMMKEIRVGLATNDFSLTSNELIFIDGSSMRNDFTNAVLNPKLDPDVFTWKPEPDYKVTEPMGK